MSKREAITRYSLIIQRLRRSSASLKEINDYLSRESELRGYNFNISARTFKRDLEDIFSLYSIDIQYDFSRRAYHIVEFEQPDVNNRMLEAFDTLNALNITEGLSHYVHFEKRKPQGTEHFYGLLHAVKNGIIICFDYQKFWDDKPSRRLVNPYALKEFKGRWYLLAKDLKDERLKTFGLDRMQNLELTKKKFIYPKDLDVGQLFKNCFGIINPQETQIENIILSFDAEQGKYIKSFPLHESQKTITDNETELRISLDVYLTHDLLMEILSYGERVKVIAPNSLKQELSVRFTKALAHYK